MKKIRIKFGIAKTFIFFCICAAGIAIGSFVYVSASSYRNQSLAPAPKYPKNESCETYSSALDATAPETEPNLIKAEGVDGTIGYVRSADLKGNQPKNPTEAIEQQSKVKEDKKIITGVYTLNKHSACDSFKNKNTL